MSSQCCGGNDGSISQSTQREMRRLALPVSLECGVIPTVDANTKAIVSTRVDGNRPMWMRGLQQHLRWLTMRE